MRTLINRLPLPLLMTVLVACSSTGALVEEKLDPKTGVTVLRAAAPTILYRDNSAYAAHARDYVYLGPIETNRMGTYNYFLWLGIWNTVRDDERSPNVRDGFESVVLFVDGKPLPLEFAGWTLDAIGVSEPVYVKPVASAADGYYHVTLDQIRLIAAAGDIELHVGTARPAAYRLWERQGSAGASMRAFLEHGYD